MYPYERLIKYFLSKNNTNEQINEILNQLNYLTLTDEEIDSRRTDLFQGIKSPTKFITDKKTAGKAEWWKANGINDLWDLEGRTESIEWMQMKALLKDPRLRGAVEVLLLQRQTPDEISPVIGNLFKLPVSSGVIGLFKKYCWDIDIDYTDWIDYFNRIPEDSRERYKISLGLYKTSDQAKAELGCYEYSDVLGYLNEIMKDSFFQFKKCASLESGTGAVMAEIAERWGKLALQAARMLTDISKGTKKKFDKELQTKLEFVEHDIPKLIIGDGKK